MKTLRCHRRHQLFRERCGFPLQIRGQHLASKRRGDQSTRTMRRRDVQAIGDGTYEREIEPGNTEKLRR